MSFICGLDAMCMFRSIVIVFESKFQSIFFGSIPQPITSPNEALDHIYHMEITPETHPPGSIS